MRFEIFHEIRYSYSKPVFFEPHLFFLRPREDAQHRLIRFEIKIDPEPSRQWSFLDLSGNNPFSASFSGIWDSLSIRTRSEVEVLCPNPFDYLLEEPFSRLPARYHGETAKNMGPYLGNAADKTVKEFSDSVSVKAGSGATSFLMELCAAVYSGFKKIHRPEGGPWPGVVTLERKEGSCRDLTVLFMECCRAQGLAARFTSGYYCKIDPENAEPELHAWPEVYLEGAGWRGFDPTVGLACAEFHVPLASAGEAEQVSPAQGCFRGDGVSAQMDAQVRISTPLIFAL